MGLRQSYTVIAPIYDLFVAQATHAMRKGSLQRINQLSKTDDKILLLGVGTGLDIPLLPENRDYIGVDITPAMLRKAKSRISNSRISLQLGDALNLSFENNSFDIVVMHLILAVVPDPVRALQEAQRVLKNHGYILILDKFLRPGQLALIRRMINPFIRHIATQTNVTFEKILSTCPELSVLNDEPVLAGGWFRNIVLQKKYN